MASLNEISVKQRARLVGTPGAPQVVDICLAEDFSLDPFVIPGAIRHRFDDLEGLRDRLKGRGSVIVCQRGRKLSQGVSAYLRSAGLASEYLGGGAVAWRQEQPDLCLPFDSLPQEKPSARLWVTRHRPKVDRIACPWLLRRFVDPQAQILFVSASEVLPVAERFGAIPFDVEGAAFGHHGTGCSFDSLLDAFHLRSEALLRMAEVIRAADLGRPGAVPQAAGLLALSVGLSRLHKDDQAQLAAGLTLYDALYAWARDGFSEEHRHDANI